MKKIESVRAGWARVLILIGIGLFLLALVLSAFFVPQLRVLHFLQALIYVTIAILALRNSPWGFGAGVFISLVWNCLNLFITHLFQAGLGQLVTFVRTGHASRPDTLMVSIGGIGHFILIIGCMVAFLKLSPSVKQWGQFCGGGFLAVAYLILIVTVAAPR
jgi:hypothetical protein